MKLLCKEHRTCNNNQQNTHTWLGQWHFMTKLLIKQRQSDIPRWRHATETYYPNNGPVNRCSYHSIALDVHNLLNRRVVDDVRHLNTQLGTIVTALYQSIAFVGWYCSTDGIRSITETIRHHRPLDSKKIFNDFCWHCFLASRMTTWYYYFENIFALPQNR